MMIGERNIRVQGLLEENIEKDTKENVEEYTQENIEDDAEVESKKPPCKDDQGLANP